LQAKNKQVEIAFNMENGIPKSKAQHHPQLHHSHDLIPPAHFRVPRPQTAPPIAEQKKTIRGKV
jgi:hypothetical protein